MSQLSLWAEHKPDGGAGLALLSSSSGLFSLTAGEETLSGPT